MDKEPHVLLWAASQTAREKIITGIPNSLNYCVIFTVYKGKVVPVQVGTDSDDSRRLRLPEFLDNRIFL